MAPEKQPKVQERPKAPAVETGKKETVTSQDKEAREKARRKIDTDWQKFMALAKFEPSSVYEDKKTLPFYKTKTTEGVGQSGGIENNEKKGPTLADMLDTIFEGKYFGLAKNRTDKNQVAKLQQALNMVNDLLGGQKLKEDGKLGPKTTEAIKLAYQRKMQQMEAQKINVADNSQKVKDRKPPEAKPGFYPMEENGKEEKIVKMHPDQGRV